MNLYDFIEENSCLKNVREYVQKYNIKNYGQEQYLNQVFKYLRRLKKGNVLLLGKPGIGKSALIETLASAINENKVPNFLKGKIILELSLGGAVAGTKYRGEFEEKIQNILKFVSKRKNIILFIDEAHNILKAGGAEGAIACGDMLKPYLARGEIKLIVATTKLDYKMTIKHDKAMNRRFGKINMKEPSILETINILTSVKEQYEKHYDIKLNNYDIRNIVFSSIAKRGTFPDKAFDTLEDYCYEMSVED